MATAEHAGRQQEDTHRRVWDRIEDRRAELGMTFNDLAAKTGWSRYTVNRWRNGKIRTSNEALTSLERALQLPHGELLRLAGRAAPALPGTTSSVSMAILAATDLEQHEKEALLRVYESFQAGKRHME